MRINIYAEELTSETEVITKEVDGRKFYGVRLYLHSPKELHRTVADDDRSAITFWVPWKHGANRHEILGEVFAELCNAQVAAATVDSVPK